MGFWERVSEGIDLLGRSVEAAGSDAVRATREFSQIQRLKGDIADAKRSVNTQYLRLGRKYYEAHRDDPDIQDDEMIRSIQEGLARIAACEQEIAELKQSGESARVWSAEAAQAQEAAQTVAAQDRAAQRMMQEEAQRAEDAEADDIMDYQPVEPAGEDDFVAE